MTGVANLWKAPTLVGAYVIADNWPRLIRSLLAPRPLACPAVALPKWGNSLLVTRYSPLICSGQTL